MQHPKSDHGLCNQIKLLGSLQYQNCSFGPVRLIVHHVVSAFSAMHVCEQVNQLLPAVVQPKTAHLKGAPLFCEERPLKAVPGNIVIQVWQLQLCEDLHTKR